MAHTQDNKSDYKLTQNSIEQETKAPEHLIWVTGRAGLPAYGSRRAEGSLVKPCALQMQRLQSRAKLQALGASLTCSTAAKPPVGRDLTLFSSVQQLLAVGDHLPG